MPAFLTGEQFAVRGWVRRIFREGQIRCRFAFELLRGLSGRGIGTIAECDSEDKKDHRESDENQTSLEAIDHWAKCSVCYVDCQCLVSLLGHLGGMRVSSLATDPPLLFNFSR
ncbi:MAG: hypothetical protein AAGJ83_09025 [Planctomycetota bacterium]